MAHQPPPGGGGYASSTDAKWWPGYGASQAQGAAPNGAHYSQQQPGSQQQLPPHIPSATDDPASLLAVYPLGNYLPTARVASHFAPHTDTLQPPTLSTDVYAQYGGLFQAMNAPQYAHEEQLRAQMAMRVAQNLTADGFSSYGNLPYVPPNIASHQAQVSSSSSTSPTASSSSFLTPSATSFPSSLPPQARTHTSAAAHNLAQYQQYQTPPQQQQQRAHHNYGANYATPSSGGQYQLPSPSAASQYRQPVLSQPLPQLQPSVVAKSPSVPQTQVPAKSPVAQFQSPITQFQSPPAQQRQVVPPSPVQQHMQQGQTSPYGQQPPSFPGQSPRFTSTPVASAAYAPSSSTSSVPYQQQLPYASPSQAQGTLNNLLSQAGLQQYSQQQYSHQQYAPQQYAQQQYSPVQAQQYSQHQYQQAPPQQQATQQPTPQQKKVKSPLLPSPVQGMAAPPQPQQQQAPARAEPLSQHQQQQHQQQQQQQYLQHYQQPVAPQSIQPLPYAFLPQNLKLAKPPTPISLTGSPAPSVTNEYFENYIDRTLKIHSPSPLASGSAQPPAASIPTVSTPVRPAPTVGLSTPVVPQHPAAAPVAAPLPSLVAPAATTVSPAALLAAPVARPPLPSDSKLFSVVTSKEKSYQIPTVEIPMSSPSMLKMESPAKKRKVNSGQSSNAAPSRQSTASPSTPLKRKQTPTVVIELQAMAPEQRSEYLSIQTSEGKRPSQEDDDEELEDELDFGKGDGEWALPSPDEEEEVSVEPTSHRTGDKDQRTAIQKLQSLFEDIFEEADSFTANPTAEEVDSSSFFEGLAADGVHPVLATKTIEKIILYTARVQDTRKRQRKTEAGAIPWDVDSLLRLFCMLERNMRDAEGVNPFPDNGRKAVVNPSPKKGGKKGGKKGAGGPSMDTPELEMTAEEQDTGDSALEVMKVASTAAFCILAILSYRTTPKQLYSEDLLSLAVTTIRNQMTNIIFPVVEALAGEQLSSNYLAHIVTNEASTASKAKSSRKAMLFDNSSLASIAQSTCGAVPHIAKLVSRTDMTFSDTLVIQTIYLAVGAIFVKEPPSRRGRSKSDGSGGPTWSVMKSLRTDSLACLRGAFAKYEDQRQWILEEILGSLGRNQEQGSGQSSFQLPDGQSISTLTALLLQLIQASSYGVGTRIRKLRASQMDVDESAEQPALAEEESRIIKEALDNSRRSTSIITLFLVQKASGNKNTKVSADTDFKIILDAVVSDLLRVLYRPEWPAAAEFVNALSKYLVNSSAGEASTTKSVALDYLGDIGARLRTLQLQMAEPPKVCSLDEIIANPKLAELNKLNEMHLTLEGFLASAARDDSMYQSSGELTRILWAQEINTGLTKALSVIERLAMENGEDELEMREHLAQVVKFTRKIGYEVWSTTASVFDVAATKRAEDATFASFAIGRTNPLQDGFDRILERLISSMNLSGVALRSKALRGLASIVVTDPNILSLDVVRDAIDQRLSDSSPAVRDAAVDLIGKYVVQRSEWADQYFPTIAERITDSGLSVRKRVVKLLRDMCAAADNEATKVKICVTLIKAVEDEDDGIKDLALKSLSDILFPSSFKSTTTAKLLVDILDETRSSEEHLVKRALEGISKICTEAGRKDWFAMTVESLIGAMVDATEVETFDGQNHIRAIFLLCYENPSVIDTSKASVLGSYLKQQPANTTEVATNNLLLDIFTRAMPYLPKAASTFANELTQKTRVMIGKPTHYSCLPQPIACYAAVVSNITKEYKAMTALLRSVVMKSSSASETQLPILMYISALIAQHGRLDAVAQNDPEICNILNSFTGGRPLSEFLFEKFLGWSGVQNDFQKDSQKLPILCLGALFCGYPQLILGTKTDQWMTTIAQSNNMENKAHLLVLLRAFLDSEVERRESAASTTKDVNDLIGSASDLHESSISTALVQRNMEFIIDGAKSSLSALRSAAMDVLSFTIKHGLYHPLKILPLLISLETSEDPRISRNALDMHAILHGKHSTMLNIRFLDFARDSFDYQKTITGEVSGARHGVALLAPWWSLLSEKRAVRIDFLKHVVRAFDFELAGQDEINTEFVLYMAENLAVLDYQHQEEVMLLIQYLSRLVSDNGAAVANALDLGAVDGTGVGLIAGKMTIVSVAEQFPATRVANASIVVALAILTKNFLLCLYNLQEDKCLNFVAGKKSAVGERPVTRRPDAAATLDWSRVALVRGVQTYEDYALQRETFLQMMKEDGNMGWSV